MKFVNERMVEAGVRRTGHDGVMADYLRAREMNADETASVARAASRQFSPWGYEKPLGGLISVGAAVLAMIVTVGYLAR